MVDWKEPSKMVSTSLRAENSNFVISASLKPHILIASRHSAPQLIWGRKPGGGRGDYGFVTVVVTGALPGASTRLGACVEAAVAIAIVRLQ